MGNPRHPGHQLHQQGGIAPCSVLDASPFDRLPLSNRYLILFSDQRVISAEPIWRKHIGLRRIGYLISCVLFADMRYGYADI